MEEWRDIPSPEHSGKYEVSNLGRVRYTESGKIVNQYLAGPLRNGVDGQRPYFYVSIRPAVRGACAKMNRSVHRLVALAFVDGRDDGPHVNHKNCNKRDNRAENLEWVTRAGNTKHAMDNGRIVRGEAVHGSKLTDGRVAMMRQLHRHGGLSAAELAPVFGVTPSNVAYILRGKTWAHVSG